MIYENLTINKNIVRDNQINIIVHFIEGAFVEIKGNNEKEFLVKILDGNNNVVYDTILRCNMWAKTSKTYFDNWTILIYEKNELIFEHKYNAENKRVYIHLDSSSLGDSLAWFPMVEEFRKKHKSKIICSTFNNDLFKNEYPEIEFVNPGTVVNDIYAMYTIGWFYNEDNNINFNKNPLNFRDQHLQKTAADILGIKFDTEIKPKLSFIPSERPIKEKYFCIANHSTAQSKYWNNPNGWQEVVDHLKSEGYTVVLLSKEPDGYMGNKNPKGVIKLDNKTLQEIMNYLYYSEGFVGLGSGLSWLAWSLNKKVFLISGFSRPNCEMTDCIRIFTPNPSNTCNGCFNDYRLDAGDWNWCPKFKGTDRQFECTKKITSEMIIEKIKKF